MKRFPFCAVVCCTEGKSVGVSMRLSPSPDNTAPNCPLAVPQRSAMSGAVMKGDVMDWIAEEAWC